MFEDPIANQLAEQHILAQTHLGRLNRVVLILDVTIPASRDAFSDGIGHDFKFLSRPAEDLLAEQAVGSSASHGRNRRMPCMECGVHGMHGMHGMHGKRGSGDAWEAGMHGKRGSGEAGKRGSGEAGKRGSGEAGKRGSGEAGCGDAGMHGKRGCMGSGEAGSGEAGKRGGSSSSGCASFVVRRIAATANQRQLKFFIDSLG